MSEVVQAGGGGGGVGGSTVSVHCPLLSTSPDIHLFC